MAWDRCIFFVKSKILKKMGNPEDGTGRKGNALREEKYVT
jgi:hypothetical protein